MKAAFHERHITYRGAVMEPIKKQYIVDEQNRRVAVQVDVETFEKMEALLEDYALFRLMEEALGIDEAKAFYASL